MPLAEHNGKGIFASKNSEVDFFRNYIQKQELNNWGKQWVDQLIVLTRKKL